MTVDEFLLEQSTKTTVETTRCDPCQRMVRRRAGDVFDSGRDQSTCVMVDEYGYAQYMVITEDGRWVPAENY